MAGEETHFSKRFAKVPGFSEYADQVFAQGGIKRPSMTSDGAYDSDPGPLVLQSESHLNETSEAPKKNRERTISSLIDGEKISSKSCGAQWDVFRRQDVPRLSEYLRRHSDEFIHKHVSHEHIVCRVHLCYLTNHSVHLLQVVHPILDQSFFLDATHKLRLKEEFRMYCFDFFPNIFMSNACGVINFLCQQKLNHGLLSKMLEKLSSFLPDVLTRSGIERSEEPCILLTIFLF